MKKNGITAFILFALLSLLILTGISAIADTIKVGAILPLTGKLSRFGEIERCAFQMAVEELNSTGGIKGKNIELIIEDTRGESRVGRSAIEKLISKDGVCLVTGGISSSATWAALQVARKNKIPFLITTASADKITEKGGDYIFRLAPPVSEHFIPMVSFFKNVARVKTVCVLYENTLFGQSRLRDFIRQCKKTGITIMSKEAYEVGETDFNRLLSKIKGIEPDVFYMICSSIVQDASLIVRQAMNLELNAKLYMGDGPVFTKTEFQQDSGIISEYIFSLTPWTPSVKYPGVADYNLEFVSICNETADYHGAQAYAAMEVIVDALKRKESCAPTDVRDALAETDIMTVFGPVKFISYSKKKHQNKATTFLGQWVNGNFEAVWPETYTGGNYVYPRPDWGESGVNFEDTDEGDIPFQ